MDAVITYVNGLDPVWRKSYETHVGVQAVTKYYRDWGTLKYLLRGIETHMPFIRNVYLVVSGESQIPEWADRENLHIVLHEDIIPRSFLPTFNSTAIELFLYRIKGLDEEFLYFNDDFFPVSDSRADDFFRDGKASIRFTRHFYSCGMYKKHVRNADCLARKALGLRHSINFVRPQHTCYPMIRSEAAELFSKVEADLLASVTSIRKSINCNGYVFEDYLYYKGKTEPARFNSKYFSLALVPIGRICSYIVSPRRSFVCINDVSLPESRFIEYRTRLHEAFEKKFPCKSRFELK